jgi:5'-phosphate synthase pdxT subunit
MAIIGVLALQGGFAAHAAVLRGLGHEAREVRVPADLLGLEGIVLPGGESSVQLKLLAESGLEAPLVELLRSGIPALGTCAGLILLAREVYAGSTRAAQRSFGLLDVRVQRNAWGRQLESFEARSERGHPVLFIRAPRIEAVGPGVVVLDRFAGEPILVRAGSVFGSCFHPELIASQGALHAEIFGAPRGNQAIVRQYL